MPFTVQCDSCRSKFAFPDAAYEARIAGKVVDLTCKHCRKNIRIDGTKPRSDIPSGTEPKKVPAPTPAEKSFDGEADLPSVKPDKRTSGQPARGTGAGELDADLPSLKPEPPKDADLPSLKPAKRGSGVSDADLPSAKPQAKAESKEPQAGTSALKAPTRAKLSATRSLQDIPVQAKSRSSIRVPLPKVTMAGSSSTAVPLARTKVVPSTEVNKPKAKLSATPIRVVEPKASAAADDDFDQPTQVFQRDDVSVSPKAQPAAPKSAPTAAKPPPAVAPKAPPPRRSAGMKATMMGVAPPRSVGMKATMMGVAPPPNPRRPPPPIPPRSQGTDAKSEQEAAESLPNAVAEVTAEPISPLAQTAMVSAPPTFPAGAGSKGKLGGGTMLGLAPPQGDYEPENTGNHDRTTLEMAQTQVAFGDDAQLSPGLPPHDTQPLPDPSPDALPPTGVLELVDDSDPVAAAEPPLPDGFGGAAAAGQPLEHVAPPAATAAEQDPADWDSATSDVSRQIAQSVPNGQPPKRRRGRWLLAAMVAILGGVAGAGFLVIDGRVKLPPAAQAVLAKYVPRLQAPAAVGPAAEQNTTAAAAEKPATQPATEGAGEASPAADSPKPEEVAEAPAAAREDTPAAEAAKDEPSDGSEEVAQAEDSPPEPDAEAAEAAPAAAAEEDAPGDGANAEPSELKPRLATPVTAVPEGVNVALMQHRTRLRMIRAEKCHLGGRATGDATVLITFGPDGRVVDASVKGEPIASAPVATCLQMFARSVVVPKFEGREFTVAYALTLH